MNGPRDPSGSDAKLPTAPPAPDAEGSETLGSAPTTPLPRFEQGYVFAARYRIEHVLGRGGMGEVYRAYDQTLERAVALKIVRVDAASGTPNRTDARKRLLNEARLVSGLRHPHIVEFFDAGESGDLAYLVLEPCAGGNLRQAMQSDAGQTERLRWLEEIAEGLAYAHEQGVVHRDIKPENVLLTGERRAKVADFGIAKALKLDRPRGNTNVSIVGTPRYMAPEQIFGDPVDGRADQFAWGVVAYELLSGAHPRSYDVDAPRSSGESLNIEVPEIPPPVRRVLLRAMAPKPSARYSDFKALLADLRRQIAMLSGVRRQRSAWGYAAAGALGVLALGAGFTWGHFGQNSGPPKTVQSPPPPDGGTVAAFDTEKIDANLIARCEPAARPALAAGLQLWRDASRRESLPKFEEAVKADSACAPASLYYLMAANYEFPIRREYFRRAREHRAKLGERELLLLDAMEPTLFEPPDYDEVRRRAETIVEKMPADIDARKLLVVSLFRSGQLDEGMAAIDEAERMVHSSSPQPIAILEIEAATIEVRRRDTAAAEERFTRCLRASPDSADCLYWRSKLYAGEGQCADAEKGFRRLTELVPQSDYGFFHLGSVLLATTSEPATARASFEERQRHIGTYGFTASTNVGHLMDEYFLAFMSGDLEKAAGFARKWNDEVSSTNNGRFRFDAAMELIGTLRQLGAIDEARKLAGRAMHEQRSWTDDVWSDAGIELARLAYLTGAIDAAEYRRVRDEWLQRSPHAPVRTWIDGYAGLPVVGADMSPPTAVGEYVLNWHDMTAEDFARSADEFLRAGRTADALQHADAAANWCLVYSGPGYLHAQLTDAQVHEATGDVSFACKKYGSLRTRLAKSPHSAAFVFAAQRMKELSCDMHAEH